MTNGHFLTPKQPCFNPSVSFPGTNYPIFHFSPASGDGLKSDTISLALS